jgi:transcriptional regulator with XRE-family HTH domain
MLNTMGNRSAPVGEIVRHWRRLNKISQMELALDVEVSSRHLSFVETGRSQPSRALLLRLAGALNLPLRQRNALLLAAGYAPEFSNLGLDADRMALVQQALRRILDKHEPYPALVVNVGYDIIMMNDGYRRAAAWFAGADALQKYSNSYRLVFAADGLQPYFREWAVVRHSLLARLFGEATASQDSALLALHQELAAPEAAADGPQLPSPLELSVPVMDVTLEKKGRRARFFSTFTTFGAPLDVTVQELRIESLFPADEETKAWLDSNADELF